MAEPKWVLAMGVCASSGGMFNNYAIVQGVDHVVPVDIYLPGCPPRPEMLLHAILKLHAKIQEMPLGVNREEAIARSRAGRAGGHADHRTARACCGDDAPTATAARARHRRRRHARSSAFAAACSAPRAPATPPATAGWSARSRCRAARRGPTAATSTRSSTRWPTALGEDAFAAAVERVVVLRDELTLEVRREHLPRWRRRCATTRRCGSSCASASAACTTPTTPAANCTRSTR